LLGKLQRKRERITITAILFRSQNTDSIDGVFQPKRGHQDLFQTSLIVSHQQIPDWSNAVIFAYFPPPITFSPHSGKAFDFVINHEFCLRLVALLSAQCISSKATT
jgi:hypothetical protein